MGKHPWLDFKAIRAGASFSAVLARYNVELRRVNSTTLKGDCPLPSHSSNSKGTFYVNTEKNVWYCHSDTCKKNGRRAGGNVIDFVLAMEKLPSPYDAAAKLAEWYPECNRVDSGGGKTEAKNETRPEAGRESNDLHHNNPVPPVNLPLAFELKGIVHDHPLLAERGITPSTAQAWGVGFFPGKGSMAGRIVFPLRNLEGVLIGYAGRAVNGGEPKWRLPAGLVKDFLYGLDRCEPSKPLILTEGFWGALWFHQNGQQAAAIIGTSLTEAQEQALEPYATIIVAMDNDAAGRDAAAKIAQRLKDRHKVSKAFVME